MKKLSFAIALLLMATLVSAQTNENAADKSKKQKKEQAAPKPQVDFESLVIDLGDIEKSNKPAEAIYRFKNTGKDPVILTNVRASCGCTAPEWTKNPVLPKKTGEIKVQYRNTHIVGSFSKTISVTSNKNSEKPITLTIKGKVIDTATPAAE